MKTRPRDHSASRIPPLMLSQTQTSSSSVCIGPVVPVVTFRVGGGAGYGFISQHGFIFINKTQQVAGLCDARKISPASRCDCEIIFFLNCRLHVGETIQPTVFLCAQCFVDNLINAQLRRAEAVLVSHSQLQALPTHIKPSRTGPAAA